MLSAFRKVFYVGKWEYFGTNTWVDPREVNIVPPRLDGFARKILTEPFKILIHFGGALISLRQQIYIKIGANLAQIAENISLKLKVD